MNNQSTFNLDDPKNYIQPIPLVDSTRFEDTQSIKMAEQSPQKTAAASVAQNISTTKNDNVAQQTAQSQKINYSVKNVESDIEKTSNSAIGIFNKSNIVVFAWFIAIYFIIFIIIQRLLMKQEVQQSTSQGIASIFTGESSQSGVETPEMTTSRLVDFTLLIVFIVLGVVGYQALSKYDQEHFLKYCWNWMKDDMNDPTSIFVFSFILLAFYLTTYLLNIPMGSEKPLSISIIENKLWIWLVLLIIVAFCKYILNVPIVDWFSNWVNDIWTSNNFYNNTNNSSNNLTNKYHNVLVDNAGDFKIIQPPAPIVPGSSTMPPAPPLSPPPPPPPPIVGSGSGSGSGVKYEYDEVFNIGNNLYTYDDAQSVCKAFGARLATYGEIEQSYNDGAEWCNYGWSEDQMAFFPTQKETWDKLQKMEGHRNDCGRPGVNGGFMVNPHIKFGANCFGKKPTPKDTDLMIMKGRAESINHHHIETPEEDRYLRERAEYWKNHADKLQINSFNVKKWSEY
jgi:hypothetical protein